MISIDDGRALRAPVPLTTARRLVNAMFKPLLIATDGSEHGTKAGRTGLALAKSLDARATVATVTEPWTAVASAEIGLFFPIDDDETVCESGVVKILGDVKEIAKEAAYTCETQHIEDRFAEDGIIEAAKARHCDLIVLASHGRRGVARLLLGSQAHKVATHSPVPMLIYH